MKLIVGLGNPGVEYQNTRHNFGYMVLDNLAVELNVSISKTKFNANYQQVIVNNEKILLVKPLSYMNLSGEVIKKFVDYYNINIENILIISDDLDQKLGNFKLKHSGSSGGHNGLKNIEEHLKTNNFKRLKLGISNDKKLETKDYVLGKFNEDELHIVKDVLSITNDILIDYASLDFERLMSKYNLRGKNNV